MGPPVEAIVLSAGRATRMGRPKHRIAIGGVPMLVRVVRALRAAGARGVTVVLRSDDREGAELASGAGARIAFSSDPDEGRAASIRAGLAAAPADAAGLLFALADQPLLEAEDFARLLACFAARPDAIVSARYAGVSGAPVLFPARLRSELAALRGESGGRELLVRFSAAVVHADLDPARARDLDRPEDLAAVDVEGSAGTLRRAVERTLAIVKPDAVAAGSAFAILHRIEQAGLRVVALRLLRLERPRAEEFYEVHRQRPFYASLVRFMTSGPVVVAVLEADDAVARYRKLMGATDPAKAEAGTLRREFASDVERNAVHGSDSIENAAREVAFFFSALEPVERS